MHDTARRWRSALAGTLVVGAVASIGVAAALADGRVGSAARTHDGGAWLLNRGESAIGNVNRVVGEVASTAGPFTGDFTVSQAEGAVVVTNRGAGEVVLIDTELVMPLAPLPVPAGTEAYAVPGGVALYHPESGDLWRFSRGELGALTELSGAPPLLDAAPAAPVAVAPDGTIVVAEADGTAVHTVAPGFTSEPVTWTLGGGDPTTDLVRQVTLVGDTPVLLHDSGRLVVAAPGRARPLGGTMAALQQPGRADAGAVVAVAADATVQRIDLATGAATPVPGDRDGIARGAADIRPIVHAGCVWSVSRDPVVFHFCGRSAPLPNATGRIELRLVNGWVWVNDVDTGGIWFVDEEHLEVTEINDWSAALRETDDEQDATDEAGGDEELVADHDADELVDELAQLDDDERNDVPDAVDDRSATRQGRPLFVDVLANDTDPDNDPLTVELLTGLAPGADDAAGGRTAGRVDGATVQIAADGSGVMVTPDVDFVGTITFGYGIHDGRQGRDEATVTVEVAPPDPALNRPPETVTDNATVREGEQVTIDVLANDRDPDGDVLVLVDADTAPDGQAGSVNFTPDGQISYTPPIGTAGAVDGAAKKTVSIGYTVADDFGAEASGVLRVRVGLAASNAAPVPRNDVGRTSVGHSLVLDVLANDSDPDGDPLVAQNLQLTPLGGGTGVSGGAAGAQLTLDGRFVFRPEQAGSYRFTYTVTDGPQSATAQIHVDVDPAQENRPPVAVVDTVALAIGETRLVRVLDNDGDPDGDVIGLVAWAPDPTGGLQITEVPGVGFNVTAAPTANPRSEFRYWISDGVADQVMGTVVVSALARPPVDYPPIARPDVVDARPGATTTVPVLRNDHDPEGRLLSIVGPVEQPAEALVRVTPDGQALLVTVHPGQRFGFRFSYDVADPAGNRDSAVVQVRVVPPEQPNRAPVAAPDVATTPHATPVVVAAVANDYDPDGDTITIESIATQPAHGRVEILPDGDLRYTPAAGFSGTDRFVYTLVDGYTAAPGGAADEGPGRDLGEVLVGVMPAVVGNRPPVAVDDSGFPDVAYGTESPVELGVLANDSDPDSDPLVVASVTTPQLGRARVSPGRNGVLYTPPPDDGSGAQQPRSVTFAYTVSDGRGGTATAQVTLRLVEAPDPIAPVAVDDTVGPVTARRVITIDPRGNDLDPDGGPAELVVDPATTTAEDAAGATVPAYTVNDDGTIDVVAPLATGEIPYTVTDPQGLTSEPAFIRVLVTPNQAPVIEPIAVETEFETAVEIDVGARVSDPDADPLVITLGRQRTGGAPEVVGDGDGMVVRFVPDDGFVGGAGFDVTVDDRNGHVVTGTVSVTVLPPENREPTARAATVTVQAGIDEIVRLADLVDDPDGPDEHRFAVGAVTGPIRVGAPRGPGEVVVSSELTSGGATAGFDYTVVDGPHTVSNRVTVELVVADFAAPTANTDTARTLQGRATAPIPLLANDVDHSPTGLSGAGLTVVEVGVSPSGTVRRDGDTVVFVPADDFFGRAMFTYTVQDGRRSADRQSVGTVEVDVVGRPAVPAPPHVDAVGDRYLIVGWAPPSGDAARAPVTGYVLRYVDSAGRFGEVRFDQPTTSYRWDGLANATEYCFQVAAVNEAGDGEFSPPAANGGAACGVPDVRPEAPLAPTVEFGDGRLTVRWDPPANAGSPIDNYRVRISGGASDIVSVGNVTSYTWEGLTNGTTYTFEVAAHNGAVGDNDGWGDFSPLSAPEHPLTQPAAPVDPTAVRGDRQVTVRWGAPADGGDAITRYDIRSNLDTTWRAVTPQGSVNTYTWEQIPNGTEVRFEVRAVNRDPRSTTAPNVATSNPVVPCTVPDAPAAPAVTRGDRQVTVSWAAPDAQGCAISGYRITASGGATQTAGPDATQHVFTGLTNGTAYTFTVTAVNEVVTDDGVAPKPSPESAAVTPAGAPFATSITTAAPVRPRTILVAWSAADGNGTPVRRYEVLVNGATTVDVGDVTAWEHVSDGSTFTYQVRAVNDVGVGPWSAPATATNWTVPGTPAVSASAGGPTGPWVDGSWTAPANGGTALTAKQVRLYDGACGSSQVGTQRDSSQPTQRWSGLANNHTYRVCVRYQNAVGWGPWGSATATTPSPPQPSVTALKGDTFYGTNGTCSPGQCAFIGFDLRNFAPNTTYNWYINTENAGAWGNPRTVTTNGEGRALKTGQSCSIGSCTQWPIYGHNFGWVEVCVNGICDRVQF